VYSLQTHFVTLRWVRHFHTDIVLALAINCLCRWSLRDWLRTSANSYRHSRASRRTTRATRTPCWTTRSLAAAENTTQQVKLLGHDTQTQTAQRGTHLG
jgi:hypothetical protein